jgi:hypothetical protein
MTDNKIATERKTNDRKYNSHRKKNKTDNIIVTEKEKQMTDNIIATERKTNERQ